MQSFSARKAKSSCANFYCIVYLICIILGQLKFCISTIFYQIDNLIGFNQVIAFLFLKIFYKIHLLKVGEVSYLKFKQLHYFLQIKLCVCVHVRKFGWLSCTNIVKDKLPLTYLNKHKAKPFWSISCEIWNELQFLEKIEYFLNGLIHKWILKICFKCFNIQ